VRAVVAGVSSIGQLNSETSITPLFFLSAFRTASVLNSIIDFSKDSDNVLLVRRLIVNPGTEMAWEIPLRAAKITLGRNDDNDVVLDDPSISGSHCVLFVSDSAVTIKDLGSANGIKLGQVLVDEAELPPGQLIEIGDVKLQYEASPAPANPLPQSVMMGKLNCRIHRRNLARYFCPQCQSAFCDLCVSSRNVQGRVAHVCRTCAVECTTLEIPLDETPPEKPFRRQILAAFAYPFLGDGTYSLVLGTIMLLLVSGATYLSRFAFIYGFTALVFLTVFSGGYVMSYSKLILTTTAEGKDEMPDWPEISDYSSDLVAPFFQMLGLITCCFAPAIAMIIFMGIQGNALGDTYIYGWCLYALILLGGFYVPMAFTGIAIFDSLAAVNPLLVIPSITRVIGTYLLTVSVLVIILVIRYLLGSFFSAYLKIPIVPDMIMGLIGLYLLIVEVRLLGLMYRTKKEELAWF